MLLRESSSILCSVYLELAVLQASFVPFFPSPGSSWFPMSMTTVHSAKRWWADSAS